jgi:hypothetical protein
LMNICLQSDEVLSDERVSSSADALLDGYLNSFGDSEDDVLSFSKQCYRHSEPSNKIKNASHEHFEDNEEVKGKRLLEKFVENEGSSRSHSQIPREELRSLVAFVEDITKSFKEYGAQFDFCTKCIRALLVPAFPSSLRCRVLQELDGMLHVWTLPEEETNDREVSLLLEKIVSGGLSIADGSVPDSIDILNQATSILARAQARYAGKYITWYCIALLARNLGSSLEDTGHLKAAKSRLEKLDAITIDVICRATRVARDGGGSRMALTNGVMRALGGNPSVHINETAVVTAEFIEQVMKDNNLLQ